MKRLLVPVIVVGLSIVARPATAADKTHQQIMAEIRMLQEQTAQLGQMLAALADTLKTATSKIDEQTGSNRKAFADQKLLVDGIAEGVRILREKADDTNVRLSSMNQELESIRQALSTLPAAPTVPASTEPAPGTDPAAVTTPPPGGTTSLPPAISPDKAYRAAYSDYTASQYDLAIAGFEFFLKQFPQSIQAPEAQLNIGNSYYAMGNYREAVTAFQKVISDYSKSNLVSTAYYKLGLSYEGLKQIELARRAYETVIKTYPDGVDVQLARQRLEALNRR